MSGPSLISSCRICLRNCASRSIFPSKKTEDSKKAVPVYEMMTSVLSLTVNRGDGLPNKVCSLCCSRLSSAYALKALAARSYRTLLASLLPPIKVECEDQVSIKEEVDEAETPHRPDDDADWDADEKDDLPLIDFQTKTEVLKIDVEETNEKPEKKKRERMKKGEGKKVKAGVCDECGKFVRNVCMHRRTHTKLKRQFPCHDCDRVFHDYSGRRRHYTIYHLGQLYYCEICNKHYKHADGHIRLKHSTRSKDFKCVSCDMSFFTASRLQNHITVHTKERSFPCTVCGKMFRTKADSNYHRRSVHDKEKPYVCQYCPKAFFSSTKLKDHLRTHTNEKLFKCKECDKEFFTGACLRMHAKRHSGLKPERCVLCNKNFLTKGNLRSHMLTHTKEKNYPCKYCGVKFGRSDHRNRHQRTAHENVTTKP